ncbi:NRDE family protein [Candidatus Sumerlaeota bacterium]|nr:NRDE family protein [Candidatus Sumerlaeota bacterium]
MCTVTYFKHGDDYLLTMNRDERDDRGREIPPRRFRLNDEQPESAWPIDSDSGGTWIGANHHGVAACILNGYDKSDDSRKHFKSRGTIIPLILRLKSLDRVERWLAKDFEAASFKSFSLIVVQRDAILCVHSDGMGTVTFERRDPAPQLWTSSSWKPREVIPWRATRFAAWFDEGATLNMAGIPTFHLLQQDGMAEWSPMMKRDKSATRSITQVATSPSRVVLHYWRTPLKNDCALDRELILGASSS